MSNPTAPPAPPSAPEPSEGGGRWMTNAEFIAMHNAIRDAWEACFTERYAQAPPARTFMPPVLPGIVPPWN